MCSGVCTDEGTLQPPADSGTAIVLTFDSSTATSVRLTLGCVHASAIKQNLVRALILLALFPLQVFDYDFGFQDDFMGAAQVHLESLEHQRSSAPLLSFCLSRINTLLPFLVVLKVCAILPPCGR